MLFTSCPFLSSFSGLPYIGAPTVEEDAEFVPGGGRRKPVFFDRDPTVRDDDGVIIVTPSNGISLIDLIRSNVMVASVEPVVTLAPRVTISTSTTNYELLLYGTMNHKRARTPVHTITI